MVDNRQRLLKLLQILLQETDEENEISLNEIKQRLRTELGTEITLNDTTLKGDIKSINDAGFYIDENIGRQGKKLYRHEGLFELHEIRLLLDAVVSARFLTIDETKKLIEKIKKLKSHKSARKLNNQISLEGVIKANNNTVRFGIDTIHAAISGRNKICFQYGRYNVNKEFTLSHDGDFYTIHPYALIWNSDYYYLIGFYEKAEELRHYRVDRMQNVTIQEEKYNPKRINIREYVNQSFHMYSGKEELIRLQFDNHLINVIIDRFGLDADIRKIDDTSFLLTTNASVSEGLIRWILTWGSDVKVILPLHLKENIGKEAVKMAELYKDIQK